MAQAVRVIVIACCHGDTRQNGTWEPQVPPWDVANRYGIMRNHRAVKHCGCDERDMVVWEAVDGA